MKGLCNLGRRTCIRAFLVVGASLTLLETQALAQTSIPGIGGIALTRNSRMHATGQAGLGYDSNPDRLQTSASDWRGLFRAGLSFEAPGPDLDFNAQTNVTVAQYIGVGANDAQTQMGGDGSLQLSARGSRVQFTLNDRFFRTPTYLEDIGTLGIDERRFSQWTNALVSRLAFSPAGSALEFSMQYSFGITISDDLPSSQLHGITGQARLKLLPRTYVYASGHFSLFAPFRDVAGTTLRSTPYNATVGADGQITNKISANLSFGYGDTLTWINGFFSALSTESNRTLLAAAQLQYALSEGNTLIVGYRRTVAAVVVLDAYTSGSPYLGVRLNLHRDLIAIAAQAAYEMRSFGAGARETQLITTDVSMSYRVAPIVRLVASYRAFHQLPRSDDASDTESIRLIEKFSRHQVNLSVSLRY